MNINQVLFFIFIFSRLAINYAFAQTTAYVHYTVDDGLPQQQITTVYQDVRGFLWIGTKGGLARFDGKEFKSFGRDQGLEFLELTNIFPYGDSLLIINARNHYYAFDGHLFTRIHQEKQNYQFLDAVKPPYLFLKNSIGVDMYNLETKQHISLKNNQSKIIQVINHKDSLFFLDKKGRFGYLDDGFVPKTINQIDTSKKTISLCCFDSKIFLRAKSKKLVKLYDIYSNKPVLSIAKNKQPRSLVASSPNYVQGFTGNIWYEKNKLTSKYDSINISFYPAFIYDKDHNYWIGTENGLYHYFSNSSFFDTPPFKNIWSVIQDPSNNIFRLLHYNKEEYWCNNKVEIVPNRQPIMRRYFFSFGSTVKDSCLYIPTSGGIIIHKKSGEQISTHLYDKYQVLMTILLKNGTVLGGSKEKIIYISPNDSVTIIPIPSDIVSHESNYIRALLELPNGNVLLGSNDGIALWNPTTNRFLKQELPKSHIRIVSLEIDRDGNVWSGSDNGLLLSQDTGHTFVEIMADVFDNEIITDVTLIKDSLLLVGTSRRLVGVIPQSIMTAHPRYKVYNHENGFQGIEVAQNGIQVFGDKVWVPGIAGLTIFDKNEFERGVPEFYSLWIDAINGDVLTFKANKTKKYSLTKNVNNITIDFTAIGANQPSSKMYSYRLLGHQDQWSAWTKNKTALFNELGSGTYTFCLRKKNTTRGKSKTLQFKIVVDLRIEKEPYFPILAGLVICFLAFLVGWAFYIGQKRKFRAQLEVMRADAAQLRAEREAKKNVKLETDIKDFKIQYSTIRHYTRRVLRNTQAILGLASRGKSKDVQSFAQAISDRLSSYISVLNILKNNDSGSINVKKQLTILIKHLQNAGANTAIKINLTVPDDLVIATERISNLTSLITELIINSFNYAQSPENQLVINIEICQKSDKLYQLKYWDNGPGIPSQQPDNKSVGLYLIKGHAKMMGGLAVFEKGCVLVEFYQS